MKSYTCRLCAAILILCVSFGCLAFGIMPQDLDYQNKELCVLTPPIPKRISDAAMQALERYLAKGHFSSIDIEPGASIELGRGIAVFDLLQGTWGDEYHFPVWSEGEIITVVSIMEEDGTIINAPVSIRPVYAYNCLRARGRGTNPAVVFGWDVDGASDSGTGAWIYGTEDFYSFERGIEAIAKKPKKAIDFIREDLVTGMMQVPYWAFAIQELLDAFPLMVQTIESEVKNTTISQVRLRQDNALAQAKTDINAYRVKLDETTTEKARKIFAEFGADSDDVSFLSDEAYGKDTTYEYAQDPIPFAQLQEFLNDTGFPPLSETRTYDHYMATRWITLPTHVDPFALNMHILCEDREIVAAWVETAFFSVFDDDPTEFASIYERISQRLFILGDMIDPHAIYQYFPISTSLSTIKERAATMYEAARYAPKQRYPFTRAHELGGIAIDATSNQYIATYFQNYGWTLTNPQFYAVFESNFTKTESQQLKLASRKANIHWTSGYVFDQTTQYMAGVTRKIRNNYPVFDQFYASEPHWLEGSPYPYWIDYYYTAAPDDHCAALVVVPGIPNQTTQQYERFFYAVTAKPAEIKADMQRYYKAQSK